MALAYAPPGGRIGATTPSATPTVSTLLQANNSASAAGNGAAVGGVTALGGMAAGAGADSSSNSKMQSLGDGEGADQVGWAGAL